jgi:hypothetical protein
MAMAIERVLKENLRLEPLPVGSETILPYLFPKYYDPVPENMFVPNLTVPFLTPYIDQVYARKKEHFIFSRDQRNAILGYDNGAMYDDGAIGRRITAMRIQNEATANMKVSVEEGLTVYYDLQPGQHCLHGSALEDRDNTIDGMHSDVGVLIDSGMIPLVMIHTHWKPSLFSPRDYATAFLQKRYVDNSRPVRGTMLLLPKMQIFAIATAQTPPVRNEDEVERFVHDWNVRIDQQDCKKINELEEAIKAEAYRKSERWKTTMQEGIKALETLILQKSAAPQTVAEEMQRVIDVEFNRLKQQNEAVYCPDEDEELQMKRLQLDSLRQRANFAAHTELACDMRVKLYFSTNKKDFKAWTA